MAVLNTLFKIGSINDFEGKSGMAHLMEHLMFEGSKNYPNFDESLEALMAENNAFTGQDCTNYYEILPYQYIDELIDIEIDRFTNLTLSKQSFELQKKVVIEEFKETSIQPPYGDFWHNLCKMAFKGTPYEWPVIGASVKEVEHIMHQDILNFYKKCYSPSHAIVCLIADDKEDRLISILEKKYQYIPAEKTMELVLSPLKKVVKSKTVKSKKIAQRAINIAYRIGSFGSETYFGAKMISDYLTHGTSSILYQKLVKEQKVFTEINSFVTDDSKQNLFILEGYLNQNHTIEEGINILDQELGLIMNKEVEASKLTAIVNQEKMNQLYHHYNILQLAQNLCFYEMVGLENGFQEIFEVYQNMTPSNLLKLLPLIFNEDQKIILNYQAIS
jgi:predicted Zn-dependent peptidase